MKGRNMWGGEASENCGPTYQTMLPMWLIESLSLPENTPVTLPGTDSSLTGRVGLIMACGAGIRRGRKIHLERVDTWALASTEPSPRMARNPTMSSCSSLRELTPCSF